MSESMVERIAKAISDAENGLDGDCIGDMLHEDFRVEARNGDKGMGDLNIVLRAAARAALEAIRDLPESMINHPSYVNGEWSRRNIEAFVDAALDNGKVDR